MRKNEYKSLEPFTAQYTGEWNPSEEHWLGLDFMYSNIEYRFHTGLMYDTEKKLLVIAEDNKRIVGFYF